MEKIKINSKDVKIIEKGEKKDFIRLNYKNGLMVNMPKKEFEKKYEIVKAADKKEEKAVK